MANIDLLLRSLNFIEDHLDEQMQTEDIATACFASKAALEKTFKITTNFSVHDYIIRRRMNKAARMMIEKPEMSILDIAVLYGYSSHEAFTRAFSQVWKCTPKEYKKSQKSKLHPLEILPQLSFSNEGEYMIKTVDISELYDFFKVRKDCYFVCADVQGLVPINNISMQAGDVALLETMHRMEQCGSEDDVVFRIGADEFAMLTNSTDKKYADSIKNKILAMNGELIPYEDAEIPLTLYVTTIKVDQSVVRYDELFSKLNISEEDKKTSRNEPL